MANKATVNIVPLAKPNGVKPKAVRRERADLTHYELLREVHGKIVKLETAFSMSKWVFAGVVAGGVAWLGWVTELLVSKL